MHRRSSAANRAIVLYSMSGTSPASGLMLASFRIRVTAQTGSLCQPETHSLSDRLPFGWQTPGRRSLRRHRNPRTGPEKSAPAFSFQYFCYSCLSLPLPRQVLLVVVAMDRRGTCYSPFPASSSGETHHSMSGTRSISSVAGQRYSAVMSDDLLDKLLEKRRLPKLIVVVAFDRDENGDLQTVFGPADQQSEDRAIRTGRSPGSTPVLLLGAVRPIRRSASTGSRRSCSGRRR